MAQVIRIASYINTKHGMYREYSCLHDILADDTHHPTAYQDAGLSAFWGTTGTMERTEWFFGFTSVDQLFRWVNDEEAWIVLTSLGQRVYIYDVEEHDLLRGNSQCLFKIHGYEPTKVYTTSVFRGLFEPLEKVA